MGVSLWGEAATANATDALCVNFSVVLFKDTGTPVNEKYSCQAFPSKNYLISHSGHTLPVHLRKKLH